jgi:hypothetical protein
VTHPRDQEGMRPSPHNGHERLSIEMASVMSRQIHPLPTPGSIGIIVILGGPRRCDGVGHPVREGE